MRLDDPRVLRHLRKSDPVLADLIRHAPRFAIRPDPMQSPYEALFESIVYQQLSGKAAATILGRVKASFGKDPFPSPDAVLAAPDDQLRGAGLSRAKTAAVKDLALKARDGHVPDVDA